MFNLQGMYDWAVAMCNAPNVGYSQLYRNYMTVNGITYFDCSSFVFFAMWLGGGLDVGALGYSTNLSDYKNGLANAWAVSGEAYALNLLGWQQVNVAQQYWEPGDILVRTRAHTEIVYSVSPYMSMGAHTDYDSHGNPVPLADQVSIVSASSNWDQVWRDPNSPVPPVPPPFPRIHGPMPGWLLKRAKENGGLIM